MRLPTLLLALALAGGSADTALAASSRSSWVVNELYSFNHPLAAAQPGEVATKMTKMNSAFAFFRGTAHIFYKDMASKPASAYATTQSNRTWIDGDLHLQNFGGMRDSSNNDIFDTSDFDEGYIGPFVWDVRRLAVSIELAGRELGMSSTDRKSLVAEMIDAYLGKLSDFKGTSDELTYRLKSADTNGEVKDVIAKVTGASASDVRNKYTVTATGTPNRKFISTDTTLVTVSASLKTAITTGVSSYITSIPSSKRYANSYYAVKDVRQKLGSGVGSLGRPRYLVLIEGPSTSNSDDVVLEIKEMGPSAVAIANPGALAASAYGSNEGQRAVRSMKASLSNTPVLVGWTTISGKPFLVKEKSPYQADFDYLKLDSYTKFKDAVRYMGKIMAKNHSMSDQDYDSTIISYSQDKQISEAVTSKSGFTTEIQNFADDYATQVGLDYQSFVNAKASGTPLY